jgi:hypothetical protein
MDQLAVGWLQGWGQAAGNTQHPAEGQIELCFLGGCQLPAVPASSVQGSSNSSNTSRPSVPQQQQQQVRRVFRFAVGTVSILTVCKHSTVLML